MILEGRRVDPDVARTLAQFTDFNTDLAGRRAALADLILRHPLAPEDGTYSRRDLQLPGHGAEPDVDGRLYTPADAQSPCPAILFIHGGGFTLGNVDLDDAWCVRLCRELKCTVLSINYRLAPENPYPAALEDCYSALVWLDAERANKGTIDNIAVMGMSAGGGLAAALALLARDRQGPQLSFQCLICPEIDDRFQNQSSAYEFAGFSVFSRSQKTFSWNSYLPKDGGEVPIYAAPARAGDLTNLPSAYILVAELDPLRDEGLDYAVRLIRSGVSVELHHVPGVPHGWERVAPDASVTQRCEAERIAVMRSAFARAST